MNDRIKQTKRCYRIKQLLLLVVALLLSPTFSQGGLTAIMSGLVVILLFVDIYQIEKVKRSEVASWERRQRRDQDLRELLNHPRVVE
jgi:hypothetical protein